jgi:RNA polymerase sigma-B factor
VTDEEILAAFKEYRRTGDRTVRNRLIDEHRWVATHCARRFARRGEPLADLGQVAAIGVLKAVERFDPEYGTKFATFAIPTVLGELRRHFRDATWAVRVTRSVKDRYVELNDAIDRMTNRLQRQPTPQELAGYMGITVDEVLVAIEAGANYRSVPLSPPSEHDDDDDDRSEDGVTLGDEDADLATADERLAIRRALDRLPERERLIVYLRFFEGRTQGEIAEQVGISQVHVSRLLRASLAKVGGCLEHDVDDDDTPRPPTDGSGVASRTTRRR